MRTTNLNEAKALVKTYRSVTVEQLRKKPLQEITGFGTKGTCKLCSVECKHCLYNFNKKPESIECAYQDSYIEVAGLSYNRVKDERMLVALNERADFIENLIKEIEDASSEQM